MESKKRDINKDRKQARWGRWQESVSINDTTFHVLNFGTFLCCIIKWPKMSVFNEFDITMAIKF